MQSFIRIALPEIEMLPGVAEMMKPREIFELIFCIIICQAAGIIGSIFTNLSISTRYPTLVKPSFTPSGWVIALAWIILFALMGASLFLIWQEGLDQPNVRKALYVFSAQLAVNILWSWAFFGMRSPIGGLVVIAVLWILILLTIVEFWKISKVAAMLLVPYILWVSFAGFLNLSIWRLN